MGMFDKLFGGKNKKNNEKEFIRANSDDCEDIGVVTHYKGKPLTGIMFELYDNMELLCETEMKDGLKEGMDTEYYEDGSIMMQTEYSKDECIRTVSYFDSKGVNQLEGRECVGINMLEKKDKAFYISNSLYNGSVMQEKYGGISVQDFKKGKLIIEKLFWKNGALRGDYSYEDGNKIEIRYQMEDGRLLRETKNGHKITYHEDGYVEEELNTKNGEKKTFYKSGEIKSISSYGGKKSTNYDNIKSFFENGQIESLTYSYDDMRITESYHKNAAIYRISTYNEGKIELYFDEQSNEITQMNLIPHFMKETELKLRKKYNLKEPELYEGDLFYRIEKQKFWNERIWDEKSQNWVENGKEKYCILCKISVFYNEAEYLDFTSKDFVTSISFGEFYLDKNGKYCEFETVTKIVDVNSVLEDNSMELFEKEITFSGSEKSLLSFVKGTFDKNVDINLIKDGRIVKSLTHKSKFELGNITFTHEYEKVRRVIEDLIGGEMSEIANDEYEIYASPGQSEEIIDNLFPNKYVTVCRHIYYGDFEYEGDTVSDIVQYSGDGVELYYVGGEYNEDVKKPVTVEMFIQLEEEYIIEHQPKYESFEFILIEKFTSLEDYIRNNKKDEIVSEKNQRQLEEVFYDNGNISQQYYLLNGIKDGEEINYHENGQIKYKADWENGIQNGIVISYNQNGVKIKKSNIINGHYEGTQIEWYPNGMIKAERVYKKDEIVSEKNYDMEVNKIKQEFLNFIKSVDSSFDQNINDIEITFYWDGGSFNEFTDFYINGEVTDYELESDEKVIWDIITYGNNNGVKIERHGEGTSGNISYDPKTKTIRFGTYVNDEDADYDFSF